MERTWLATKEVPCGVVCSCALGYLPIRLRLDGVDEIREENGILNEENGDIVSDNV
jgi:hypothetical protein